MLVIGITGPTGCGKTTLLQAVQQRGGYIVDCDALYYELLASEEGADLRRELQTAFPAAFDAGGRLRRKALGQLVFGDQARMAQLNEIVFFHIGRAVRARLVQAKRDGRQLLAIDAINLFESGLAGLCDTTVGVLCDRETRIRRIMARDSLTRDYAALRVDAQKPDSFYKDHCTTILQNAGTRESFARAADQYLTNTVKGAFPMTKQEREALLYQPKHGRDRLSKADEAAMQTYCEAYKAFLDRSKTERECVVSAVELAEQAGFRALQDGMALQPGDKVYSVNRGKSILLAVIGSKSLAEGANIGAAHTDAPRLDFKPNPLYEDAELAYFKTHHTAASASTSGSRSRWSCTARSSAPTAARSSSRSAPIPPTRSSSSTTCCRIWAASRAKNPSTRPSRPNRSTSSSAAGPSPTTTARTASSLPSCASCTRNTASWRRISSPPSLRPSRPPTRGTWALTAA